MILENPLRENKAFECFLGRIRLQHHTVDILLELVSGVGAAKQNLLLVEILLLFSGNVTDDELPIDFKELLCLAVTELFNVRAQQLRKEHQLFLTFIFEFVQRSSCDFPLLLFVPLPEYVEA